MNDVRVVVTGLEWMGSGIRSIESAVDEMFQQVQDEVLISAYSVGNTSERIFGRLEDVLARGVRVHMVVNRLGAQPDAVIKALKALGKRYPYFHLYSFESTEEMADLHAKTIVVDRKTALVGSANISYRGWTTNHELALLVTGEAVRVIAGVLGNLLSSTHCKKVTD